MLANENGFAGLIGDFEHFDDDAMARAPRVIALLLDRRPSADRVADEDRLDEPEPVVAVRHRARIDRARRRADADAEDKRAVGHAALEVLRRAPYRIHVMGKEIAGLAG